VKHSQYAHFVLAGDGELRPEVEKRIAEHGIGDRITLLGWQSDMPEVYRNLDIVVLTSLWEGLPCVFSEAMAGELPLVATNVDGAREAIVDGHNGFLHQPHDIEGMANSVMKLLDDPELRQTMGQRGKSRVMEFDISTSVANLESAYQECLESL
jgi:glycosyltransferase involved in cell wall biosynthesis